MQRKILTLIIMISFLVACAQHKSIQKSNRSFIEYHCNNGLKDYTAKVSRETNRQITVIRPEGSFRLDQITSEAGNKFTNGQLLWWTDSNRGFFKFTNSPIIEQCTVKPGQAIY